MTIIVSTLRQFIQLLLKEIALCGEDGAAPIHVAQNAIATFSVDRLEFANNDPLQALRACWNILVSMKDEVIFARSWMEALNPGRKPHPTLEDAIQKEFLMFASPHAQSYALGARPWISSYIFDKQPSNKCLLVLKCIAMARQKGVLVTTMMQVLGMSSADVHQHLSSLQSQSLVSSRKCNIAVEEVRTSTSLWHLASLPAASLPLAGNSNGDVAVICPSVSVEHLDLCMEILRNAGGTLTVDAFAHRLSRHPQLEGDGESFSQGRGYIRLEEVLTQLRNVRRVLIFQQSSCRYKVPALQIYEPSEAEQPESSYPFQLLPKVPLSHQVLSFIHDCGSAGCTVLDMHERLRIPKKTLASILEQLNVDEFDKKKQSSGRTQIYVYMSQFTSTQPPSVLKVSNELAFSTTKREHLTEPTVSSAQPAHAASRIVPWQHLDLNDLQSKRLDVMYTHLLLNPVISLSVLSAHVMEQERLSNHQYKMSDKTFFKLVEILLPFVEATHIQSVIMSDGVSVTMLLPMNMSASDPAVVEAYSKYCACRNMNKTKKRLPLLLGIEPQPPISKRRKAISATAADQIEENDIGDAPDLKPAHDDFDNANDLRDCTDDFSIEQFHAYRRLLGIHSNFIRAYLLHTFIMSRGLKTVSADALLSMLPIKLLIKIVGIPFLKSDTLFKLFQELKSLPAHAMDCTTFPREKLLIKDRRNKSGFLRAWNILLNLSILRRQNPLFTHESSEVLTLEVLVSQSIIIEHVEPEMFDNFSQFGCVYYEPSLCVFSLQNSTELRQLWTFLRHLAPNIDSNSAHNPNSALSLLNALQLPDILRCGGVFRHDFTAKKRRSIVGWCLFRFSGPIVSALSDFLRDTPDLQGTLETKIFPIKWLSQIVPQVLSYELRYEGLEIFTVNKKIYNQRAKVQFLLGGENDEDEDAEAARYESSPWNLDSESKLLSFLLLHHSDSLQPGCTPSREDLDTFCELVNWELLSQFVNEPAVACRNRFLQLASSFQFSTALQVFLEKFPEPAADRTVTTQLAEELATDILVKILSFSDSFLGGEAEALDSFASTNESTKILSPWEASFNDCLAAGLVIKRAFYADHYDPAVAAAAQDIESLLQPDRVVAGTTCLASFGATLVPRNEKANASQILRWSNIPKAVSEKLRVDKAPMNRVSLLRKTEDFQSGVENVPSVIANVSSGVDAAALAVLHMRGQLSFEHDCRIDNTGEPVVQSNKKISMFDYLQNQGILRPIKPRDKDAEAADDGVDLQLPECTDTSRFMYRLNDQDVKIFKRCRHPIADLDLEPSSWKTDFPSETVERASSFVHGEASGVDVRLVCNAVGIDDDDAIAFRRHLLSGMCSLLHI